MARSMARSIDGMLEGTLEGALEGTQLASGAPLAVQLIITPQLTS